MATLKERKDSAGTWYAIVNGEGYVVGGAEPHAEGGWVTWGTGPFEYARFDTLDEIRNTY